MVIMGIARSLADKIGELGSLKRKQKEYQEGGMFSFFTKTWQQEPL